MATPRQGKLTGKGGSKGYGQGGGKGVDWVLSDPWAEAVLDAAVAEQVEVDPWAEAAVAESGDPWGPHAGAWEEEGGGDIYGPSSHGAVYGGKAAPRPTAAPSAAAGKGGATISPGGKARASIPAGGKGGGPISGKGAAFGGGGAAAAGKGGAYVGSGTAAGKGGAFGGGAPAAGKGGTFCAFGGGFETGYKMAAAAMGGKGPRAAWAAATAAAGGGKGKHLSAADLKPASEGMLYEAIGEVVQSLAELEKEWDAQTLEKKLRGYFNKGAKHMEFKGELTPLINTYADNVLASIFAGVGDRDWLYAGQVDFVLVLDAGIKDTFPNYLMRGTAQEDFEQIVLSAYERAFDEQRFFPLLSEAVPTYVTGPKTKKKVWNAVDKARKDTASQGYDNAQDFATAWITATCGLVDDVSGGNLAGTLNSAEMTQLFTALLEAGGLPAALTQEAEAPVGIVVDVVSAAYGECCGGAGQPASKKMRGVLPNWDTPDYGGKGAAYYAGNAAATAA